MTAVFGMTATLSCGSLIANHWWPGIDFDIPCFIGVSDHYAIALGAAVFGPPSLQEALSPHKQFLT